MTTHTGRPRIGRPHRTAIAVAAACLLLTGCAGEGSSLGGGDDAALDVLDIDYAGYNVLGLVIKDQGWLEAALAAEGTTVNWVQSAGSNKANEALRAGALDVGLTGGPPAVQARANGSPIETVLISGASYGFGFMVPADSEIESVEELRGKTIAVTRGTDPFFFALQALQQHGLTAGDVTFENLQHADGRAALDSGTVDAWSGLDPILSSAELAGVRPLYTDPTLIPGSHVNVTESFADAHPDTVQLVADAYAKASDWVLANPDEAVRIYAEGAGIDLAVAERAFGHMDFDLSQVPDVSALTAQQRTIGTFMVESGDVASQEAFDDALSTLYVTSFAEDADPGRIDAVAAGL